MSLFDAVTPDDMREAQIVTTVALAAFIGSGLIPGVREHANRVRLAVLVLYLLVFLVLLTRALLR